VLVVEALASDAHTVARSVRSAAPLPGQLTIRHTLRRLALLSLTRCALGAQGRWITSGDDSLWI
jgi:hypothetical protein